MTDGLGWVVFALLVHAHPRNEDAETQGHKRISPPRNPALCLANPSLSWADSNMTCGSAQGSLLGTKRQGSSPADSAGRPWAGLIRGLLELLPQACQAS